jgi:hypothetical protein
VTKTVIDSKAGLVNRVITVDNDGMVFLKVWDGSREIQTNLTAWESKALPQLITALVGEDAVVITDLPEVTFGFPPFGTREYAKAGNVEKWVDADPEKLVKTAKGLLAIAAVITKRNEEKAEAEKVKAEEDAKRTRRDKLVQELSGNPETAYEFATPLSQAAVDRIIELEEAAK